MYDTLETSIQTHVDIERTIADMNTLVQDLKMKLNGYDHQLGEVTDLLKLRSDLKRAAFGLQRTIEAPKEIIKYDREQETITLDNRTFSFYIEPATGVHRVTIDDSGEVYLSDPQVEVEWHDGDDNLDGEWLVAKPEKHELALRYIGDVVDPNYKSCIPHAWIVDFDNLTARRGSTPPTYTL